MVVGWFAALNCADSTLFILDPQVQAFVHEGFEANKTFLRRYDTKNEYVLRADEFEECRRSFLSEWCAQRRRRAGRH